MAAALFNKRHDIATDSAGLAASGAPACENTVSAMKELDIDLSAHISKQVTTELLQSATRIVCMTSSHKEYLLRIGAPEEKITVLDVSDPFGGDLNVYRICRDELVKKIDGL